MLAAAAASLGAPSAARATTNTWIDGAGNWATAGNWSKGVPAGGQNVLISNADNVDRTVTYNYTGAAVALAGLEIDLIGGLNFNTLSISTNNLVSAYEDVGIDGNGAIVQSGGTNTVTGNFSTGDLGLGVGGGSLGTYLLSGGALVADQERVGVQGTATFTQTGGTNTILATSGLYLYIGYAGGQGTYGISGGTLSAPDVYVGGAPGYSGGAGTLNVSGTASVTVSGTLKVYNTPGTSVLINGGTLNIAMLDLNGAIAQSGGTNTVTVSEDVGVHGTATVTQTGGTNTILGTYGLYIGCAGGQGTYGISGGTLSAPTVYVGGSPGYSGGTGTLNVSGTASVTVSGTLKVYNTPGTSVSINGGTLNVATLDTSGNPSSFNWYGGTLSLTASGLTVDTTGPLGASLYLNSSQALSVSGTITNNGSITLAGGTIFSPVTIVNNSTITGYGRIAANNGINNTGLITQGAGNLVLSNPGISSNNGTITLAAGRLLSFEGNPILNNYGTLALNGATVNGAGTFINTPSGVLIGPGTIATSSLSLSGVVQCGAGMLNITSAWTNPGVVQLTGLTSELSGGAVTNSGAIQGCGTVAAAVTNSGSIQAIDGPLTVIGALANASGGTLETLSGPITLDGGLTNATGATIAVTAGNKILVTTGLTTNAGLISLVGGTFDNGGKTMSNTGSIVGFGVLRSGGLTNNGSVTLTGGVTTVNGPVTNASGKNLFIKFNPAIFTGAVTNNGSIKVTNTTVTFASSYSGNAYISDPSDNYFQGAVTIVAGGYMTGSAGDGFYISGLFTNQGTFGNGGDLTANAITNSGTFSQTGSASYSGNFTNSAGNAMLGGTQAWSSGAALNAAGGSVTLNSDPGGGAAYNLAVDVTPATGSATLHIAAAATNGVHLRDLLVNVPGSGGAGLVLIDAAATGATSNPRTHFGAAGGSVAVYLGNGAGGPGLAPRATVEDLWRSAALEGYWALQNGKVTAITRGVTFGPGVVTNPSRNGLVVIPSIDELNQPVTYVGEDIQGDTNGDAKVDVNDVGVVLQHLNTTPGLVVGEAGYTLYTPGEGDVNGDLTTDVNDLGVVLANLNQTYSPAAAVGGAQGTTPVPEPGGMVLLTGGAALVARRRRGTLVG